MQIKSMKVLAYFDGFQQRLEVTLLVDRSKAPDAGAWRKSKVMAAAIGGTFVNKLTL